MILNKAVSCLSPVILSSFVIDQGGGYLHFNITMICKRQHKSSLRNENQSSRQKNHDFSFGKVRPFSPLEFKK
ncbi:hypothetical protein KIY57_06300 [Heyndrickxia coagulans]|jgi:hypothetical protein|nr:hypothetical protein KIY57_06300 [Heyndrickxia coagulans]